MVETVAQIIGFVAMGIAIVSFQQKSQRGIILFQLFSSLLWVINFILLGGIVGALLNGVGVFSSLVFGNKEKFLDMLFYNTEFGCFTGREILRL